VQHHGSLAGDGVTCRPITGFNDGDDHAVRALRERHRIAPDDLTLHAQPGKSLIF
jgi:hypothetical protein